MTDKAQQEHPEWDQVIGFMGGNIFPVSRELLCEKYDPEIIVQMILNGLISQSRSKIGPHPTQMKIAKGYLELSDSGWDRYKILEDSGLLKINTHG